MPFSEVAQPRPCVMVELRDVTYSATELLKCPAAPSRAPGNTLAVQAQKTQLELSCYSTECIKSNKITQCQGQFLVPEASWRGIPIV